VSGADPLPVSASMDASTLDVERRRNRLKLLGTLVIATLLYWLAVMTAVVVVVMVLVLRIVFEGIDAFTSVDP
jgi:hypothetical protein